MEKNQEESLSQLFEKGLDLHSEVLDSTEDTNSQTLQDKVRKGVLMLEDATRLVSLLDIFSTNENYSELPTEHLKFFLLPVLLGDLNNKLTESERKEVVETVQVYYIDYLERCKDYGFTIDSIPKLVKFKNDSEEEEDVETVPRMPNMGKMSAERAAKMARYKQSKQLDSDIRELKAVLGGATRDEDVVRDYYLKLIQKFVNTSLDELSSLEMEVGVLRHMEKMRAGHVVVEEEKPQRRLQPIIITADKLQKEVYGLGYPSLPVLSVDEFYEKRIADGWWKPPSSGGALQDRAANPDLEAEQVEQEEREKDLAEDRDDEEARAKAQGWDLYKDDHRRGEGNRHNMG